MSSYLLFTQLKLVQKWKIENILPYFGVQLERFNIIINHLKTLIDIKMYWDITIPLLKTVNVQYKSFNRSPYKQIITQSINVQNFKSTDPCGLISMLTSMIFYCFLVMIKIYSLLLLIVYLCHTFWLFN